MKRLLFLFLLFTTNMTCFACTVPYMSEEINALITIVKGKTEPGGSELTYIIRFPEMVDGIGVSSAELQLYTDKHMDELEKKRQHKDEIILPEQYIRTPIALESHGKDMVGRISVKDFDGLNIGVVVNWHPGGCCTCATIATKEIKHNQTMKNDAAK